MLLSPAIVIADHLVNTPTLANVGDNILMSMLLPFLPTHMFSLVGITASLSPGNILQTHLQMPTLPYTIFDLLYAFKLNLFSHLPQEPL